MCRSDVRAHSRDTPAGVLHMKYCVSSVWVHLADMLSCPEGRVTQSDSNNKQRRWAREKLFEMKAVLSVASPDSAWSGVIVWLWFQVPRKLQIWGITAGANDTAGYSVTGRGGHILLGLRSSLKSRMLSGALYQVQQMQGLPQWFVNLT